jgi:hypothetical protein
LLSYRNRNYGKGERSRKLYGIEFVTESEEKLGNFRNFLKLKRFLFRLGEKTTEVLKTVFFRYVFRSKLYHWLRFVLRFCRLWIRLTIVENLNLVSGHNKNVTKSSKNFNVRKIFNSSFRSQFFRNAFTQNSKFIQNSSKFKIRLKFIQTLCLSEYDDFWKRNANHENLSDRMMLIFLASFFRIFAHFVCDRGKYSLRKETKTY